MSKETPSQQPKPARSTRRQQNKKGIEDAPAISEPPILKVLADLFEQHRPKVKPVYPVDPETNTIHLPPPVVRELKSLIRTGEKITAVKRVATLTGAGLRIAKDYVDSLNK